MSDHPLPLPYADCHTPVAQGYSPELFGDGMYSNLATARLVVHGSKITIAPAPMPVVGIIVTNLIILALFAAWIYLVYTHAGSRFDQRFGMIAGGAIAVVTVTALTGLMIWSYSRARCRGDWLVIDRSARMLLLPQEGRIEPLSRLVRLEYLTRWQRDHRGLKMDGSLSELHVILSEEAGREERICLLRANPGIYRKLCHELAAHAGVPVLNVSEPVFGEELKIVPMGGE